MSPELLAQVVALLGGLCVGSFLNVVIHRLPLMMEQRWRDEAFALTHPDEALPERTPFNLATPRSRCPHCGHAIAWYENIPVVSWLFLRAKCSACKAPISARYPVVELVTGLLTLLVFSLVEGEWLVAGALLFTWSLIALTLIDYDTQLLPDDITLPLAWLGLLVAMVPGGVTLEDAVVGAIAGYLVLWSVYWAFRLATGKEGMGYGDFKLLAALGAWCGWQKLALIVVLSSGIGAAVGIAMIAVLGHDRARPIPFGPFLAAAGFIAFLGGDALLSGPLALFRIG